METFTLTRRMVLAGLASLPALPASAQPASRAHALIAAARRQIGVTLAYDPAYTRLAFPGGDVPRAKGVCTDVVIRAYRDALALDLQALVHADMRAAFAAYPRRWGLKRADSNIDHRRVPNLQTFLARKRAQLPIPSELSGWQAGDIMTCLVGGTLPHIAIVSDRRTMIAGRPLIIHNIGQGTREEDALGEHRITGRYRWLG
jgi:uncharacterized protein YijF (DUF1287 family)